MVPAPLPLIVPLLLCLVAASGATLPRRGNIEAGATSSRRRLAEDDLYTDGKFDLSKAFTAWQSQVGCEAFRKQYESTSASASGTTLKWPPNPSLQSVDEPKCGDTKLRHVTVYVPKEHQGWLDGQLMEGYHFCPRCRTTCQITWEDVIATRPDATVYVAPSNPPPERQAGEPLRVFVDVARAGGDTALDPSAFDILVAPTTAYPWNTQRATSSRILQLTFSSFWDASKDGYNHDIMATKREDAIMHWHPHICSNRTALEVGKAIQRLVATHVFGSCEGLNPTGEEGPVNDNICNTEKENDVCFASNYKFELVVDPYPKPGVISWDLFKAFHAGSVPVYWGPPDAADFLPPESFIDVSRLGTTEELKELLYDLHLHGVQYMNYFAWRFCGVYGNFRHTLALGLREFPCRLCELVSAMHGRMHAS